MIAFRQADVDDLNDRARLAYASPPGSVTGRTLRTVGGREFAVPATASCVSSNDRRLGVGQRDLRARWPRSTADGLLVIRPDQGGLRHGSRGAYLEAGHVTHGYAITGHKAQGVDGRPRVRARLDDTLDREWGYVALSRGRESNRLYVHAAATDPHDITHGRQAEPDPHQETLAGLRRSAAQTPAVDFLQLDSQEELQLAIERRGLARQIDYYHARRTDLLERHAELEQRIARIESDTTRLEDRRDQLGGDRQVAPDVRDEITDLDRRLATNRHSLDDTTRDLASVHRQLDELAPDQQVRTWRRQLSAVERRIERAAETRTRRAVRQPPRYILTSIGGPPTDEQGRRCWAEAVRTVESYRVRFGITNQSHPLGHPGADPGQRDQRRAAIRALTEALPHGWQLDHHPVRERSRTLGRSLTR